VAKDSNEDRRRYMRVKAPILSRPVGVVEQVRPRHVRDISHGGIRTYADESMPRGRRLEIELIFPDSTSATLLVQVAWTAPLPEGSPAKYELGLQILEARPEDLARIARVLEAVSGEAREGEGD
jgi:PilZ domain